MVSLVVLRQSTGEAVHVIFLVVTGSAYTYLSHAVYTALGYVDSIPKAAELNVHGVAVTVSPSPIDSHFADVNVLGQDFFRDGGVDLVVRHSRADKAVWLLRPARRRRFVCTQTHAHAHAEAPKQHVRSQSPLCRLPCLPPS